MPPKRYHVFISHNSKDKAKISDLVKELQRDGFEVWFDIDDIVAGENWEKQVLKELEDSKVCVVFFSEDGWGPHHLAEVKMAQAISEIKIIPVFLPGAPDNKSLNQIFFEQSGLSGKITYLDFRSQFNIQTALILLKKAILGEGKGLDWSEKLERDARNWENRRQSTYSGKLLKDTQEWSKKNPSEVSEKGWAFINASLAAQSARLRQIIMGLTLTVTCITCLALYAFIQRNIAVSNENARATAQANAEIEADARATAQAIAEEQANIALARQLAAQAELLSTQADTGSQTIQSGLLAIESLRINPSIQADHALRNTISSIGTPVYILEGNLYLSNDATFLVMIEENTAIISKTDSQIRIFEINHDAEIIDAYFSSDDKLLFTLDSSGIVRVTNIGLKNSRSINLSNQDNTDIISSADGRLLAAWSIYRNEVEIINVTDGEFLHQVIQDTGEDVGEVKFSPDGNLIATGSFHSGYVDIWETTTGKHIKSIQYIGNILTTNFSPDSKYIAVGETSGAHILEAISGKEICRISLELVVQVHFSSDGQRIVIATGVSGHGEADVLDIFQCKEISKMNHHDAVTDANFNNDETMVISSGIDGTARVWNAVTGEEISRIVHDKDVFIAKFIQDSDMVISISGSDSEFQTAIIWYPKSHEALTLHHDAEVTSIAFSPDGTKFVTGTNTGVVSLWDIAFGKLIYQFHQDSFIEQVYFLPDNNRIVVVASSNRGTISVWDVHTGSNLIKFGPDAAITTSTVSLDGRYIVSGDAYGNAIAWEISTGKELAHKKHADAVWVVAFNPNGKWVASVGNDDLVSVWDIQTSKEITSYYHDFWVNDIHFSPDGTLVISSSNDKTSRVWDIQNSKELARFTLDNTVWVSVFNPNAEIIASGSADSTARLWKTYTGSEIHRFQHESWVGEITFSQDGRWMVTGTINGIMRIWNVVTFQEYSNFQVNQVISDLRFSPDENYIATPINENNVYIWSWKHEYLIEKLCYLLPRNLTTEEWSQYFGNIEYHATCPTLPTPNN